MNQQYQNLYQSGTPYSTPPVSPTDSTNPTFVKHLILSIAQLVFVIEISIIPLILTIIANSAWKRGNYEKYRIITKVANVLLIIGWIILVVEAIVLLTRQLNNLTNHKKCDIIEI